MPLLTLLIMLPLATNYLSIQAAAKELLSQTRNGPDHIVLGETETMADYIIAHTPANHREAYLLTAPESINFFKPLKFIAGRNKFKILGAKSINKIPFGESAFYIQNSGIEENKISGKIIASKNFGQVTLYQLTN